MLNYTDVKALRDKGMSNIDIMTTMSRVVPSASKVIRDMSADKVKTDVEKDQIIGKMLDDLTPRNAPSGMPYLNAIGLNAAQKSHDLTETRMSNDASIMDQGIQSNPSRYHVPSEGITPMNILPSAAKMTGNAALDAWDFAKAVVTDPGTVVKGMIDPIVGAGQAAVDAAVPGQLFGDTEPKKAAYALAHAYGLPQVVEGIGSLLQGKGMKGIQEISKGFEQAGTTSFENPLSTYLLGKGAKSMISGGLKLGGAAGEGAISRFTAGAESVPLDSYAASAGRAAGAVRGAGEAVAKFGSSDIAGGIRSATPEILRKPIEAVGNKAIGATVAAPRVLANGALQVGKFMTSKLSGLNSETINTVIQKPGLYAQAEDGSITVGTVASKIKDSIETRLKEISETGSRYGEIRNSGKYVTLEKGGIKSILKEWGLDYKKGKVVVDPDVAQVHLEGGDITALEGFLNDYFQEGRVGINRILNARQALDALAKWGENKTGASEAIAKSLRNYYDKAATTQIKELAKLDAEYAPERQFLNQVSDEYLHKEVNADGRLVYTLNDNALRKMYGSTASEFNDPQLKRLEQLVPGVGDELRVIRAIKDVKLASGIKVGTYANGLLLGGGVYTHSIPTIVAAVIMSPPILVPLLKWYGQLKGMVSQSENILTKIRSGSPLSEAQSKIVSDAVQEYTIQVGEQPYNTGSAAEGRILRTKQKGAKFKMNYPEANKVAEFKGGQKGTPGIDFTATPPVPNFDAQTTLLAEYYGTTPDVLAKDIADAGLSKPGSGSDKIGAMLSGKYGKDVAGFGKFVDQKLGDNATPADYNAAESARIAAEKIGTDSLASPRASRDNEGVTSPNNMPRLGKKDLMKVYDGKIPLSRLSEADIEFLKYEANNDGRTYPEFNATRAQDILDMVDSAKKAAPQSMSNDDAAMRAIDVQSEYLPGTKPSDAVAKLGLTDEHAPYLRETAQDALDNPQDFTDLKGGAKRYAKWLNQAADVAEKISKDDTIQLGEVYDGQASIKRSDVIDWFDTKKDAQYAIDNGEVGERAHNVGIVKVDEKFGVYRAREVRVVEDSPAKNKSLIAPDSLNNIANGFEKSVAKNLSDSELSDFRDGIDSYTKGFMETNKLKGVKMDQAYAKGLEDQLGYFKKGESTSADQTHNLVDGYYDKLSPQEAALKYGADQDGVRELIEHAKAHRSDADELPGGADAYIKWLEKVEVASDPLEPNAARELQYWKDNGDPDALVNALQDKAARKAVPRELVKELESGEYNRDTPHDVADYLDAYVKSQKRKTESVSRSGGASAIKKLASEVFDNWDGDPMNRNFSDFFDTMAVKDALGAKVWDKMDENLSMGGLRHSQVERLLNLAEKLSK